PSWISAAAALVTAGVTRLVAPVWSVGPNGEGATKFLHAASPCANAGAASARTSARVAAIRTSLMAPSFRVTPLRPSTLPRADPRRRPGAALRAGSWTRARSLSSGAGVLQLDEDLVVAARPEVRRAVGVAGGAVVHLARFERGRLDTGGPSHRQGPSLDRVEEVVVLVRVSAARLDCSERALIHPEEIVLVN